MQMQETTTYDPKARTRIDERTAQRVAELFSALGDASRVRIIAALLAGEMNVGDIAQAVELTSSAVSHQMRLLRQIRLVRANKRGREVYYTLDDEHVADLFSRGLDHVKHGS